MKRTALIISILVLGAASVDAGTFNHKPYLADAKIDVLSKSVANQEFNRDLFGSPYATVVVGNVDVYDRFPYLEARYFQVVSDPSWDRLLMGEVGQGLVAFDGVETGFGKLDSPRGMSTDGDNRVYVADSGNDRVLVFRAVSEYERMELIPLFAIEDLANPYDVAYSDGGTPFDSNDDRLYIANTGANEVRAYSMANNDAVFVAKVGELGSGMGRFAGPTAVTVGRHQGAHSPTVYVSDAHNRVVVRLQDTGAALIWQSATSHDLGVVTSLDADHWGNVYAASPQTGTVAKFTRDMLPVASYAATSGSPRAFHVPFANVTDHRTGERARAGQGNAVLVEQWEGDNGLRLVSLGVEVKNPKPLEYETGTRVTLTDHANVVAELSDPETGRVIARHDAGMLAAGPHEIRFAATDYLENFDEGTYQLTVRAASTYEDGASSEVTMPMQLSEGGGPALPDKLTSQGNWPNPFNPTTTIRFLVPAGGLRPLSVRVYNVRGALVRELESGQVGAGLQQLVWDGRNDRGQAVGSGIYLYKVEVGAEKFTGKMVMVK